MTSNTTTRFVAADSTKSVAVGIDIGGTKVAVGAVLPDGSIAKHMRRKTPSTDAQEVRDTIVAVVNELREQYDVLAVGIGAAGFVDAERSRVMFAPHLAWRDEPLRDAINAAVGVPVVVENDANAAAWAEWKFGAGRGESDMICVNLGTGIGGGIMIGGQLYRGKNGMAGEFGHMVVVPDGQRCECGNRGCLEQYASGNVLGREARELARTRSPVAVSLMQRVNGDLNALLGPVVTQAAQEGDPCAIELFDQVGHWLGVGLANVAAAFDPGMFVIGGGVCDAGEILLEPTRRSFARTLTGRGFRPQATIVRASLGPLAGLVGAADLARHEALRVTTSD